MEERRKSKVSMQLVGGASRDTHTRETDFGPKSISRLKIRRTSFGFASVPGIKPVDRTSQVQWMKVSFLNHNTKKNFSKTGGLREICRKVGLEFRRPPLLYLNTYQLEPTKKFNAYQVEKGMNKILDEAFTDHKYNDQASPIMALRIASDVMRKVKTFNFNRYRIITIVTIAQKRSQSYNNAISFLWDHERDAYVDLVRETSTAFVQVTTFAIYLD